MQACGWGIQVLTCRALVANVDTLGGLLLRHQRCAEADNRSCGAALGEARQTVAQAVAVIDRPLQEDETQARLFTPSPFSCSGSGGAATSHAAAEHAS